MNYYERIAQSIEYAEGKLEEEIKVEDMAKAAFMSVSNFHRMFFAISGYQAKEYLINRRISKAAEDIRKENLKVIDIAVKYSYSSPDAFSRIFHKITGVSPSAYANSTKKYVFERVNIMEKYFNEMDEKEREQYPDVKILSNLPDMKVAYYCYYGKNPEDGAFDVMRQWVLNNHLDIAKGNYRIFGYNAPDSDPSAEEYGYEVCVTIPDDMEVADENVKTKFLEGGRYAVVSIAHGEDLGEEIMKGWKRFSAWLEGSKFVYGNTQWLEEHLGFDKDFEHLGGVDLYMPIKEKIACNDQDDDVVEEDVNPFTIVSYTSRGNGAEAAARKYLFAWAKKQGIDVTDGTVRVFSHYNFECVHTPDFFYKLCISIPDDFVIEDENLCKETFPGGHYLRKKVKYRVNGQSWMNFIQSIESSTTYRFASQPFMEEYLLQKPAVNAETDVIQHMPVGRK